MKRVFLSGAAALGLLAHSAQAAPMVLNLTPGNMLAQTHSHAMIMTITGTYRQLSGTLNFDPAAKTCNIDVTFVVRSLTSPNALIRSQTMSKGFLDPDDFPETHYVGTCQGNSLVGNLTLRGQTHPFTMALTYESTGGVLTAIHTEGILNRYNWGVAGMSLTVSQNIRVTNDISLNGQPPVPPAS
jgi:polyisoprenoid-binding protein YceI